MSKTLGNVVDPGTRRPLRRRRVPLLPDARGALRPRRRLLQRALVGRINTDLANDLGNLLSRVLHDRQVLRRRGARRASRGPLAQSAAAGRRRRCGRLRSPHAALPGSGPRRRRTSTSTTKSPGRWPRTPRRRAARPLSARLPRGAPGDGRAALALPPGHRRADVARPRSRGHAGRGASGRLGSAAPGEVAPPVRTALPPDRRMRKGQRC